MSLMNKLFNIVTATFKIKITFEVVDSPHDYTEYKKDIKTVNIKYLFFKGKCGVNEDEREKIVRERGKEIKTITRNTDQKIRTKTDYWIDDLCLFVVAEPADDWGEHYEKFVKQVQLKPGEDENISIALKPKMKH